MVSASGNFNGGYNGGYNSGAYNSGGYSGGAQIPILRYENVNNGDGNYRYRYYTYSAFKVYIAKEYKGINRLSVFSTN